MVAELNVQQNEAWEFFKAHVDEWAGNPLFKYKYGIIRDSALAGIFDTAGAAAEEAFSKYPERDFIIQEIVPPDEVVSFYSPVLV